MKTQALLVVFSIIGCQTHFANATSTDQAVASGQREILLQAQESWNGKRYTQYPSGQPELTPIESGNEPPVVIITYAGVTGVQLQLRQKVKNQNTDRN